MAAHHPISWRIVAACPKVRGFFPDPTFKAWALQIVKSPGSRFVGSFISNVYFCVQPPTFHSTHFSGLSVDARTPLSPRKAASRRLLVLLHRLPAA